MKTEEEMILEIRKLFRKGQTNPSACTSIMYYLGFEGRFVEIRKIAEYQFQIYSIAFANSKNCTKENNWGVLSEKDKEILYG